MIWGEISYGLAVSGALTGALFIVSLVSYFVRLILRLTN